MKPRSEERHEDSFLAAAAGAQVLAGAQASWTPRSFMSQSGAGTRPQVSCLPAWTLLLLPCPRGRSTSGSGATVPLQVRSSLTPRHTISPLWPETAVVLTE